MSQKPIALDSDIRRLLDEGYEIEVTNGYLVVHSVPYVNAQREVKLGRVVTDISENAGQLLPPKDHQVWFAGEFPCFSTGAPIEAVRHTSENRELWQGFAINHRFSNKLFGTNGFADYSSKMRSYISIIANEASAINPVATPCTFKVVPPIEESAVFKYRDSASSRADIVAVSEKLKMNKIAIVGLGGTGSYVLDLVAKTPVREIHLFDGDLFLQHNAFRAPGAASAEVLGEKIPKVEYYCRVYSEMRSGIVPHAVFIDRETVSRLADCEFVFMCVDNGTVRKLIAEFLQNAGISFVDVGMDLLMCAESTELVGTCRVTLSTPEKWDHFAKHAPTHDGTEDDLYRRNIQVADMNSLNAALAVIKWKRFCGFYRDAFGVHQTTYSVDAQSLTRDEMGGVATR